ncbi:ribosome hibernation-promoting factor, HPF/YfiA family [Pontivivens ytuae]|uniref:Ribosome hibernation promoting factor n=1 Tax=Pontivivens ytuae TaxID=2789856 RepID=A0A7S9LV65_9RHOB|nr:ribosome-associated translation inhibitor RaiA [Pontivivens ytuae]QPH55854.1 ribosome-associated translation inhibitor RaiA [Pontivivens ytuae]
MRLQVSGKQMDLGDAMRTHVSDRLDDVVSKYAGRPVEAVVTFSKDAHEYKCDASVHLSTGLTTQASARSTEIYAAFDSAAEKMDKQLRRYKRRLKDHHKDRQDPVEAIGEPSYVLANPDHSEEEEPDSLQPVIIAEMETPVLTLSVGEAVMQMELAQKQFLVFRNSSHGGVNVVYTRDDGNVGWIDPRRMS